jgi:hypothetical protein
MATGGLRHVAHMGAKINALKNWTRKSVKEKTKLVSLTVDGTDIGDVKPCTTGNLGIS